MSDTTERSLTPLSDVELPAKLCELCRRSGAVTLQQAYDLVERLLQQTVDGTVVDTPPCDELKCWRDVLKNHCPPPAGTTGEWLRSKAQAGGVLNPADFPIDHDRLTGRQDGVFAPKADSDLEGEE